jgi:tetratricopeptide (TPR) repeat protein
MNRSIFFLAAIVLVQSMGATCQSTATHSAKLSPQQRYRDAMTLLAKGDLEQAKIQYESFLADILHRVANGRAESGEYPEAAPVFDEAVTLAPNDASLSLDYTEAALDAHDLPKVRRLAQQLLSSFPAGSRDKRVPKLNWLLGQALLGMDDNVGARKQFEQAIVLEPSFDNQYALGQAYLALLDKDSASKLFVKMLAQFGNSARIHMQFGLAFAKAEFAEEAIPEFKKVLAMDPTMRDAHYCLGAAYLSRSGDTAFPQAEAEFHKELALHPDDFFSYYELGYEAMKLHRQEEAVSDLSRAALLNPRSDDTFLLLGELFGDMNRTADEEIALRKAIEVCTDPSRNHYQIRGAHYQLGLLLVQEGKADEGKKELQISEDLLLQNRALDAANMTGKSILRFRAPQADSVVNPAALAQLKRFEAQVGPAIADSFDNLAAILAHDQDYAAADHFFKQSAQWGSETDDLDYNWGRAAFGAKDYHQAVVCLTKYMQAHPDDNRPRVALGMSQYELADYSGAATTLAPLGSQLDSIPTLGYAYAESLVKTGDLEKGIPRLVSLEETHPDLELIPVALGAAYADEKQYANSEVQLRRALELKPDDLHAKDALAFSLLALGKLDEAQSLLVDLTKSQPGDPTIFYQLGKLQLDHGDAKDAIPNLEMAAKLAPQDSAIHLELARATDQQDNGNDTAK